MSAGRPTKYKPEYCQSIIDFFSIEPYRERKVTHRNKKGEEWTTYEDVANDLRFISQFAHKIDVNTDTIYAWEKKYPEFSDALKKARELQHNMLATNGLRGLYQVAFAIFTAKNITDWRDVKEDERAQLTQIVYNMQKENKFLSNRDKELLNANKE